MGLRRVLRVAGALALAALVTFLLGCGDSDDGSNESGDPVEGVDGSFTIELPEDWFTADDAVVDEVSREASPQIDDLLGPGASEQFEAQDIYFREGEGTANVNVITEPFPEGFSFEEAVETGATVIESRLPEAEIESGPDPATVDGEEAFEIRYAAAPTGEPLQFVLIQALDDGTVYSITLTADAETLEEAEADFAQIIESWRFN